jgi:anaerobic magnesium-protoporphyrin IX monomethyl ester cyclase
MKRILLFNPKSGNRKYRVPNSVLNIAASVDGAYDWVIVDGNRENNPYDAIATHIRKDGIRYIGFTVMPGPQLKQAIPLAKKIRAHFPETVMIWGGYFPSNHYKTVLASGYVDFVINGPGDHAFPQLIDALENNKPYELIKNLIYTSGGEIIKNAKQDLIDQDTLPQLPYDKLDRLYAMEKYLGKTYLGNKTLAYHSSIGCPFRWGADAIEFHDNNFFVSEKRTVEFSRLIQKENMVWWGEGRIDTLDKYSDASLELMRASGCKMIFFGAETGNNKVLQQMDKGGTQTGEQIERFAARIKRFDIIPEYSFVLGTPAATPEEVMEQIEFDIAFIKKIKTINPDTEIIIYTYSPVPTEGSELYNRVLAEGFRFPQQLEDWINPAWENFDLRKNPLTPWLEPAMIEKIRNFETVLNGYYPTVSDIRLNQLKRLFVKLVSGIRYKTGLYKYPYEIKLLHRLWKYRQPEIQGF